MSQEIKLNGQRCGTLLIQARSSKSKSGEYFYTCVCERCGTYQTHSEKKLSIGIGAPVGTVGAARCKYSGCPSNRLPIETSRLTNAGTGTKNQPTSQRNVEDRKDLQPTTKREAVQEFQRQVPNCRMTEANVRQLNAMLRENNMLANDSHNLMFCWKRVVELGLTKNDSSAKEQPCKNM